MPVPVCVGAVAVAVSGCAGLPLAMPPLWPVVPFWLVSVGAVCVGAGCALLVSAPVCPPESHAARPTVATPSVNASDMVVKNLDMMSMLLAIVIVAPCSTFADDFRCQRMNCL